MKIAIMTPSRGRPKELYRFFESINSTISGLNKIYFLFGIDSDDPCKYDYYNELLNMQFNSKENMIVIMIEDNKRPISKIWNELCRFKSWHDSPDIFIMGNDDLIYLTPGWDMLLEEKFKLDDHPFYCRWFDDGINGENHCAFPIVTKYWIASVGYFAPEVFLFFYHDTWVFDIAKKAGVAKYFPEVKTSHLHFSTGSSRMDDTYSQWRSNPTHKIDTDMFNALDKNRSLIAEMIKDRIDGYLKIKQTKNQNDDNNNVSIS